MTELSNLTHILNTWIRWRRTRQGAAWSVRGLLLGLVLALLLGIPSVLQARLLRTEFALLVVLLPAGVTLFAGLAAVIWPVDSRQAARRFDIVFHLDERVSTALEIGQPGSNDPDSILHKQLRDALSAAERVDPYRQYRLPFLKLESLLCLVLVLVSLLFFFQGEAWFQAAQLARALQAETAEQAEAIEEILTETEENPNLTESQIRQLSQPLQEALQGLEESQTMAGSIAALNSSRQKLEALSDPQSQQLSQALRTTGQQLAGQEGSPLQPIGQNLAEGDFIAAAAELANLDPDSLNSAENQALAGQLQQMAESLASSNPELASRLNQAAQALQNGDPDAARQALAQAGNSLADSGQQVLFSQAASQAASQLGHSAGQILAAGGGQSSSLQASQPGQAGNQNGSSGSSGSGSGSSDGTGTNAGGTGNDAIDNNAVGDGGETTYEQIHVPSLLGGEDGPLVGLPENGDEGGDPIRETLSLPSDSGESVVPYTEILPEYDEINRQAIESGEIPLQFLELIRTYFDSLEP
ncbi:MAG: hypothetical protein JXA13_01600 [Anaerolineales bacterium]|nr:hypothetical protein [Anaerolineales bacterium]